VTFRLDSDVLYANGKLLDIDTNHTVSPVLKGHIKWKKPDLMYNVSLANMYMNKEARVAQFSSHCHTFSHREILVEKLRKYIDMDIYGTCGKFK
jgi:hypothetical protein